MAVPASEFSGVAFSFAETISEIDNMQKVSSRFIDRDCMNVLPAFRNDLLFFQSTSTDNSYFWAIPEDRPLCTNISEGEFERGDRKGINVYGSICGVWEINHAPGPEHKYYIVNGLASVKVSIFALPDGGAPQEIARWRFEMGSYDSPGCHFHTQILGDKEDDSMFPHALSVPRLPSLMVTVTDALDYLLGELFQDKWKREVSQGGSGAAGVWTNSHRRRLTKLLEWKLEAVRGSTGSPWAVLKANKPANKNMFLRSGVEV